MILSPKQRYNAEHGRDVFGSDRKRGASKFPLWPYGVLVYTIDSSLGKWMVKPMSNAGWYFELRVNQS